MIKKSTVLLIINLLFLSTAKAEISEVSFPNSVAVFGLYEISFQLDSYSNPYDPEVIDVYAVFTGPDGSRYRVNGFYYEGYSFTKHNRYEKAARDKSADCWRIRFTPDQVGDWSFAIHAVDQQGPLRTTSQEGNPYRFECRPKALAEGFIRKANARYLKRERFVEGEQQYHSFYPVGPNIAWYSGADYNIYAKPYGIYDYERYVDSLDGNANYMRVWLNRYQYLSLYGPEHALRENGAPTMFFDSTLNQKDAAELDHIIDYAAKHDISLMLCLFSFGDFRDDSEGLENSVKYGSMPSGWRYNPFHALLGIEQPLEFFYHPEAKRISRNLIRYIVARWGYAPNILCWELWNEVDNTFRDNVLSESEGQFLIDWHNEMNAYITSIDPHHHLVTTSFVKYKDMAFIFDETFVGLDIVQHHRYQNIQKATSKDQLSFSLMNRSNEARAQFPTKLYFMGEFGLSSPATGIDNNSRDPKGVDVHNSLWSSVFSGSMGPASFWYWRYLDKQGLFKLFEPMNVFCKQLPILSDSFVPMTTGEVVGKSLVFPNNIETYYLINSTEDTLIGWCQDDAFSYQSLRRLSDAVGTNGHFVDDGVFDPQGYVYTLNAEKRPEPSSTSNRIVLPIENQPRGTAYLVRWFDAETGLELTEEATTVEVRKPWFRKPRVVIAFPSSIRDIRDGKVNNTYGDAVFMMTIAR